VEVAREGAVNPVTGRVVETPAVKERGLRELRERMAASLADPAAGIPRYLRNDDQFLLPFLRARKYNVAKAHMVLNNFNKFWYDPKHATIINGLCAARARPFYDLRMVQYVGVGALGVGEGAHTPHTVPPRTTPTLQDADPAHRPPRQRPQPAVRRATGHLAAHLRHANLGGAVRPGRHV